jgi:hypothetical protein
MPVDFKPPGSSFFTQAEREKLCKDKTSLVIVAAKYSKEGKYGAGFTYTLKHTDKVSGEVQTGFMTISENARRAEEFDWVCDQLVENPDGIGPVRLEQVPTDKGNPAWVFVSAKS